MIAECYLIEPFTCKKEDKISEVAKRLKKYAQRHIYVIDNDNKPVGIISVTDILDKIVIAGKNAAEFKAKDIMNTGIIVHDDHDEVKVAYKEMVDKGVVSCVVTQKGKIIGSLSLKEAVQQITNPDNVLK